MDPRGTQPLPQWHDCQKLYVFIAYMKSVKQKCGAIYLLPIAGIISTAEKDCAPKKNRLFDTKTVRFWNILLA